MKYCDVTKWHCLVKIFRMKLIKIPKLKILKTSSPCSAKIAGPVLIVFLFNRFRSCDLVSLHNIFGNISNYFSCLRPERRLRLRPSMFLAHFPWWLDQLGTWWGDLSRRTRQGRRRFQSRNLRYGCETGTSENSFIWKQYQLLDGNEIFIICELYSFIPCFIVLSPHAPLWWTLWS